MKEKAKYTLILLGSILYLNQGFAQTHEIDSLKQVLKAGKEDTNEVITLNRLSEMLWKRSALDTALRYANQAQVLAGKLDYKKGIAGALDNLGSICAEQGNYNKAFDYYSKALDLDQQIGNKKDAARILNEMGNGYLSRGINSKALECYLQALPINEEINFKKGIAANLGNIGIVYQVQGNYTKALEYHKKSLAISEELGDTLAIANHLDNMGLTYSKLGDHAKAFECLKKGIAANAKMGHKAGMANGISIIGDDYSEQGKYDSALAYYFKALAIYQTIDNKMNVAVMNCSLGAEYYNLKEYARAKEYLDSGLQKVKDAGDIEHVKSAYRALAQIDSVTKNYQSEVEEYKLYSSYRDSENNEKIVQTEMNYEFNQKEDSVKAEQIKKDAMAEADIRKQQVITWSILGGLLLVLVFSGFIFRSLRITRRQKDLIGKQKAEVEWQKQLVEEKNKDILDSITYAKRLQNAILPPLGTIKKYLTESFVLYKPKDIVAGDFYWMERAGDSILIAAADCTGHGVPGALVSVVCSNALNRTVKEFNITEPGKILGKVRELVLETFEKSEDNVQDGMDISLCCINTQTNEVQWSGAYNSLLYIREGEIYEVAADKQPIGKIDNPQPFHTHNLHLQKDDTLYLFSDGYADQFGGPKGKKLKHSQFKEILLSIHKKGMNEQKDMLEKMLKDWMGGLEQVDDILVIGIRI